MNGQTGRICDIGESLPATMWPMSLRDGILEKREPSVWPQAGPMPEQQSRKATMVVGVTATRNDALMTLSTVLIDVR
jgi:hypothetical protein